MVKCTLFPCFALPLPLIKLRSGKSEIGNCEIFFNWKSGVDLR